MTLRLSPLRLHAEPRKATRQVIATRRRRGPVRLVHVVATLMFGPVVAGYVYFTSLYNEDVLDFSPPQAALAFATATATAAPPK